MPSVRFRGTRSAVLMDVVAPQRFLLLLQVRLGDGEARIQQDLLDRPSRLQVDDGVHGQCRFIEEVLHAVRIQCALGHQRIGRRVAVEAAEIGRATRRDRVGPYFEIAVGAVSYKKKKDKTRRESYWTEE